MMGSMEYWWVCSKGFPVTKMPEDFKDAHDRHWRDAEHLLEASRQANADHLYGMSAECGLKAVLVAQGQPIVKPYRDHVNKIWRLFVSHAEGWSGAQYLAKLPDEAPFGDWCVAQRYWHRGHFQKNRVTRHRNAAKAVRTMLQSWAQGGSP